MKKMRLTRMSIDELAMKLPTIDEKKQQEYVAGYASVSFDDYLWMVERGAWPGGYVTLPNGEVAWGLASVSVTGNYPTSTNGISDSIFTVDYSKLNDPNWTSISGMYYVYNGGGGGGGSYVPPQSTTDTYNVSNAIDYLTEHAESNSQGACAKYVRLALEAGGMSTDGRPVSACDYDTWLQAKGFYLVSKEGYQPLAGDIVVFEAITGHANGHIAMYNGQQWISDFVQRDMYGGSAYRNDPAQNYTLLRK